MNILPHTPIQFHYNLLIFPHLVPFNHHLSCLFLMLCTDCPRLAVADIGFWKGIGLVYVHLLFLSAWSARINQSVSAFDRFMHDNFFDKLVEYWRCDFFYPAFALY